MKAIVLNTTDSFLNKRMEAVTLKAGFLLCNELYAAGNTGFELSIRETHNKFSTERKLDLLESWCADDPRIPEMVEEVRGLIKLTKKRKHKTTEEVHFLKKMEKNISDMLNIKIDEIEETLDKAGFEALRELRNEQQFQSYCFGNDPEKPLAGVMASSLLQRLLPSIKEDEEPEIFFLGDDFFQNDISEFAYADYLSHKALDIQNTVLHHCFTFPNINVLSSAEIKTVRSQLQQSCAAFTESINEWIDMCYFEDGIIERTRFFKEDILPLAAQLQKTIEDNETLKLYDRRQNREAKLELWFGEIPVWTLWNYYDTLNVTGDETWEKLEALREADAYRNQRWPIAILRVPVKDVPVAQETRPVFAETEIYHTKKYIAID